MGILVISLVFGMMILGCETDPSDSTGKTPEEKTTAERWEHKWIDDSSAVTINHSVADDGVCTITVGGTPVSDEWERWKGNCGYEYTAKKNKNYTYVIEAWTSTGDRTVSVQYFGGGDTNTVGGPPYLSKLLTITDMRTTYTFVGKELPRGGVIPMEFQCADQLGTFFVKIISITEGGDYDYIKIQSVMPSSNLIDGVEQQFTVKFEYCLASQEQGRIEILFNNLDEPNYLFSPDNGFIVVNKGKGSHTFNVTALTKDWTKLGYEEEFRVGVVLWPYPTPDDTYYSLEGEYKTLSFK